MHEFIKGACCVIVLAAVIAAAFAWNDDRPTPGTWAFRVGGPLLAIATFGAFLKIHFRRDKAPDYLLQITPHFFDRAGFCFAFVLRAENGHCYLDTYFQNKYERPCVGRIGLRPARGFFGRRDMSAVAFEITCGPAAFGVSTVMLPVPKPLQGSRQKFEVGASVDYPDGRGSMLRFRDGSVIRTDSEFGDAFSTSLATVAVFTGALVIPGRPPNVSLDLPSAVAEETLSNSEVVTKTLWQLGDPPLNVRSGWPAGGQERY